MNSFSKFISLLLIIFLCCKMKSSAQSFCQTREDVPDILQSVSPGQLQTAGSSYCVNIFIHVMEMDDYTGGVSLSRVNQALDYMRADFLPLGITFNILGYKEENNTVAYNDHIFAEDLDGDGKGDHPLINSHSNAIDIYLFPDNLIPATAIVPGTPSTEIIIGGPYFGFTFSDHGILSHEMGHCLGLYHTNHGTCPAGGGCEELVSGLNCSSCGDYVCDTPPDPAVLVNCFNQNTCTWTQMCWCSQFGLVDMQGAQFNPNTNLIMALTTPNCMLYHTSGQGQRMRDVIANTPFLQDVLELSGSEDLWMQDTPSDLGVEPNPTNGPWWVSEDIWVRNAQDQGLIHQNPIGSQTNYVYVRIRNRGCDASGNEDLRVYWAKASTGLLWDSQWVNYVTTWGTCTATLFGDEIPGSPFTIPPIASGETTILEIPWTPEDPSDYACFNADQTHFCLLARLETSGGMAYAENPPFGDLYANTKNNNNIAWKNITVIDMNPGPSVNGYTIVRNAYDDTVLVKLFFTIPEEEYTNSFLDYGTIKINLGEELFEKWEEGGSIGEGFQICDDTLLKITDSVAWIGNMPFDTSEMHVIETIFEQYVQQLDNCDFNFDIQQVDSLIEDTTLLTGGVRFQLNTCYQEEAERRANPFVATPAKSKTKYPYKLYPNPNTGEMQLDYYLDKEELGEFSIYDLTGRKQCTYNLNEGKNTLKINEQSINRGIYFYQMLVDGKRIASDKLVIIK